MPSGSLLILSPSLEDEGYFECTVTNEVGEERKVIEVTLQGRNQTDHKLTVPLERKTLPVNTVISDDATHTLRL